MKNNFNQILFEEEECQKKHENKLEDNSISSTFLKTRQILLTGEIDKDLSEKIIRQLLIMEAENDSPIYLYIDSPGGDADAGFAIFDMVRFVKAPVYIIGMGLVASAAALVLLAVPKERRIGLTNSHYLIHQPLSGIKGVATEIEIHAQEIIKMRARINQVISSQCSQPLEKVEKDTDRDFWLDGTEAVEYGLISRIITNRDELK
ncbi:MAG: ATP-dependent Clp protease proteolytic subunit [Spirochaetes bacterium]|uniref:ATP-dependent Clp protease proteolytic subunit n=1 Tax=Candidatus Gallitreponema excrementavium TaxID=2840840 RepID=A0A9D9N1Y7_9SPIR|nr:ATP-dependent Clp protease proteolytic subunit [Candidatus Gallitreponema excrementavium]